MRVEIQPPPIKSSTTHESPAAKSCNGLLLIRTGNGQAQRDAVRGGCAEAATIPRDNGLSTCIPPPPRNTRSTRNLSSVNVVGLPAKHARQSSVPATLTVTPTSATLTKSLLAHHSRHTSEPSRSNFASRTRSSGTLTDLPAIYPQGSNASHASAVPEAGPCISGRQHIAISANEPAASTNAKTTSALPLSNVSNVNVNYYRAVPVNVVSAVPTIQCLNNTGAGTASAMPANAKLYSNAAMTTGTLSSATDSTNVSNVNIVQAMPVSISSNASHPMTIISASAGGTTCTEVIVHSTSMSSSSSVILSTTAASKAAVRTFTSTEAQTDNSVPIPLPEPSLVARRHRRRDRNHLRRPQLLPLHPTPDDGNANGEALSLPPPYNSNALFSHPHLRDASHLHQPTLTHVPSQPASILHSGNILVAPGTILQSLVPNNFVPSGLMTNEIVPFHATGSGQVPMVQAGSAMPVAATTGYRFPLTANGFRRNRYSDGAPKRCCGLLTWRPVSLRWFISLIALVAVCCVLVGTALGAMKPSGRDHFTVSLLMIGVGIILVTVSGVAWRLTSHNSSTFRSMLGLGSTESLEACPRRFVPHLPPSYGRPHHPYAAMMYPEFQYRPPPPSYQASMQEYRLRLLLLDRGSTPQTQNTLQNVMSPPPTYRSHSGSLIRVSLSNRRDATQSEYSCPPSYRSQNSSSRTAAMLQNTSIMHSREQSLSFSESNHDASVVNVNILSANEEIALDNLTLDAMKLEPAEINPLKLLLKSTSNELESMKDGNLVTIVQTSDQNPVIVTVSGTSHSDNCNTVQITESPSEMEILAHL